ncbi:MAG TPA: VWA domain-containing protein, partial [Anaerolineae bacterium]|nr:VWA domain-containing protein [Anaerolineae bacterium]
AAHGQQRDLRRFVPTGILLAGLALLLFSLARPQMTVRLPRIEGTVILAFDVSRSMAAGDLQPTRLEAAKTAARQFVLNQPPTVLVGVVAFSDSGFVVQAPTADQEAVLATIDRLAPERGTSLANGILAALNMIATAGSELPAQRLYSNLTPVPTPTPTPVPPGTTMPAVIVLLSDGENNEQPDPLAAAATALDHGVRIYTVGIGSAEGTTLDIDGFLVHTRLDEPLLEEIAGMTGGIYYNAANEEEIQAVYANLVPQWVVKPEEIEITPVLAGAAILTMLSGGALSLFWLGRVP